MYEFKTHYDLCPKFTPNPTQVNLKNGNLNLFMLYNVYYMI
jgi:hypothetical protein